MNLSKRIYFSVLPLLILICTVYFIGCSSAESTTGKLAFQQQDFPKAVIELKKGLQVDKTDDEGWYMLGYSQIETGDFPGAEESFKKCLAISNNYADKISAYWVEKFNAGAREFKSGIDAETKKDSVRAKTSYGNALKYFEASSAIHPDSLKSISAIGETYLALGQKEKALETLNSLAEMSKSKESAERVAKIIFESGLSLMQTNNFQAAATTFKKILTIPSLPKDDPYYETSSYNVGLALAKLGEDMRNKDENSNYKEKYTEALSYLEPLTTKEFKNKELEGQVYELLVSVYANLGMTDKATDALVKMKTIKGN